MQAIERLMGGRSFIPRGIPHTCERAALVKSAYLTHAACCDCWIHVCLEVGGGYLLMYLLKHDLNRPSRRDEGVGTLGFKVCL